MARIHNILTMMTQSLLISGGLATLWAIGIHAGAFVLQTSRPLSGHAVNQRLVTDQDGNFWIRKETSFNGVRGKLEYLSVANPGEQKESIEQLEGSVVLTFGVPQPPDFLTMPDFHLMRVQSLFEVVEPLEFWWLVHDGQDPGGCWLECHSPQFPGEPIYLGKQGVTQGKPAPEQRFAMTQWNMHQTTNKLVPNLIRFESAPNTGGVLLATSEGIQLIRPEQRTVTLICELPNGFLGLSPQFVTHKSTSSDQGVQPGFMIRTRDALIQMDLSGQLQRTISLPADLQNYVLEFCRAETGREFLKAARLSAMFNRIEWNGQVFEISANDQLINRQEYHWVNVHSQQSEFSYSVEKGLGVPVPLFTGAAFAISSSVGRPWSGLQAGLRFVPAFCSIVVGLILYFRHLRRTKERACPLWVGSIVALGIFAYFGFRYVSRTSATTFPAVGAMFNERPPANGLEVFG